MTKIYRHPTTILGGGTSEIELLAHSGEAAEIVFELGDDARDADLGRLFHIRFSDGFEADAFEDELYEADEPLNHYA